MIGSSKSLSGFDPRTIPGCALWLDGADTTTISPSAGGTLTSWTDKSGTSKTITINSAPSYSTTGFNGNYPSMTFTSGNNLTLTIPSVGTGDIAVFVVWRQTTSENPQQNVFSIGTPGGGTETALGWNNGEGRYKFYRFSGSQSVNTAATNNVNVIGSALQVSGLRTLHINGVAPSGTGTESYNQTNTTAFIGGGTFPLVGQLAEVIFYIGTVTTAQQQQIEGYLAHKWGLTGYYDSSIPLSIPGCQLWLDGADSSTVTGTTSVTQWRDKSGNGRNTTTTGTVSYANSGISITTSSSYLTGSFGSPDYTGTTLSCFIVASMNSASGSVARLLGLGKVGTQDWDNLASMIAFARGGGLVLRTYRNSQTLASPPSIPAYDTRFLASSGQTSSATFMSINGGTISTQSLSGAFAINAYRIGHDLAPDDVNEQFNGVINEIIVYFSELTTTQRQSIEGYLARKWGFTSMYSALPSIHPFSSIRPHLRTFQPADIPGCQLWLDGADQGSMTLSGSTVTQWSDKSGNGYHMNTLPVSASWTGTAAYPTIGTSINGLQTVKFLAQSGLKQPTTLDGVKNLFWVGRIAAPDGTAGPYAAPIYFLLGHDTLYDWHGDFYGSKFVTTGAAQSGITSATASLFTSDSNAVTNATFGNVNMPSAPNISLLSVSGITGSTRYQGICYDRDCHPGWCGDLAEVIVFNTALTTSQRQQIEGYLAHKWGLTPSLPVISPLSIPGCAMWFDAADSNTITLSSGSLTQWNDKSGNGRNLTAVSGYANATVSSAFQNGLNVFNFSGNGLYRAAANSAVYPLDAYIIVALKSLTAQSDVLSIGPTNADNFNSLIFSEGTQSRWKNGSSYGVRNVFSTTDETSTGFLLIQWSIANNNYLLRRNGILLAQSSSFTYSLPGGSIFQVGFRHTDITAANFSGYIGEIVVFNSQLGDSQRQQIEGYLARKWGISISATLPSLHPFKSIPPATSAHFSPTDITGCQLWLDAADSSAVTIATGVSQWNDKSGNANNLTQSTTGSQPTYASSLITFANDKYLNIPATVLNNLPTWSLFFVINPISSSNWIMSKQKDGVDSYNILSMTISSTTSGGVQSGSVGNLYWRSMNAGTQLGSSDSLTTSTLQTCSLTYDGTNLYFYKNGEVNQVTTGSFAIQNQTSPNTYTLGALIYPSGIANPGVTNFRLGEMISYNTFLTTSQRERVEGYLAHKWGLLSSLSSINPYKTLPPIFPPIIQYNIIATGGTIVSTVGTTYHVFRTSSSFVVRRSVTVNYLVVGGGGGGGDRHGGGGGAGGVLSGNWSASAGTYIITVGAGGQYGSTNEGGQVAYGTPNGSGSKGGNSVLSGTGISVTANGGGGGGSYDGNPSGTVGSGGGGGGQNLPGIAGTSGQGNAGGSGLLPGAGGGGGAGGVGANANVGTGGIGTTSFSTHLLAVGYGTTFAVPTSPNTVISGGVAYIAGGGGGCAGTSPGPGGSGGLGGGGRGDWADANITAGTPNTGGGGGGTRSDLDALQTTGRNGGSGLVIVWY